MSDQLSLGLTDARGEEMRPRSPEAAALLKLLDAIAEARRQQVERAALCEQVQERLHKRETWYFARIEAHRVGYFHAMGRHLRDGKWRRTEREMLIELLVYLASVLMNLHDTDVLDDLVRYTGLSREQLLDEANADDGADEADAAADEAAFREFEAYMRENFGWGGEKNAEDEGGADAAGPQGRKSSRSKAHAKAKAKEKIEAKVSAAENEFLHDMRALYLMLARALHPDKETDAEKRAHKTEWMQKVTAAYQGKNLGALLDVLMANPLGAMGPYLEAAPGKTLAGFAKRLRKELATLKREIETIAHRYHPDVARLLHGRTVDEKGFQLWESERRKKLEIYKARSRDYATIEGLRALLREAKSYPPEYLV